MVLTGIQPPENMEKPENSLNISKAIRIPAVGGASRSQFIMSSYTPQNTISANAFFGAPKESPQRSAGSFNMVHPMGRALASSEQYRSSTSNSEDDNDENDVLMCWAKPSITDIAPALPSSPLPPCFINAYSWEDQPLLHITPTSYNNTYLPRSAPLLEPKLLSEAGRTSRGSNATHISSTASASITGSRGSSLSLTKHAYLEPVQVSFNKEIRSFQGESVSSSTMYHHVSNYREPAAEKMIEEDDSLSYCLQEDFWGQHEMLCDSDSIFQNREIIINNDIPTSISSSAALKSNSMSNETSGQGWHSKSIMSHFPAYGPPNLVENEDNGMFGSYSPPRAIKICQPTLFIAEVDAPASLNPVNHQLLSDVVGGEDPNLIYYKGKYSKADYEGLHILKKESQMLSAPSTCMQNLPLHPGSTGISSCSATLKPYYEGNIERKSPLMRSCSLTIIPPTSSCQMVEQSPPAAMIRASSLSNMGLVQGKKRSFSAVELSAAELSSRINQQGIEKMQRRRHGTATDPQSIAARTRREKFSQKIRMLQSLVPNGERLDTVSMLGQTLEYIRFLQYQLGELYHGPDHTSCLLSSSNCHDKWKAFMDPQYSSTTSNSSSITSL